MEAAMVKISLLLATTNVIVAMASERFGLPNITLICSTDYITSNNRVVNATWRPSQGNKTADDIRDEIQTCGAKINCDNGYTTERRRCPYHTATGLNGGWEWEFMYFSETTCTVEIYFVDSHDQFSEESISIENCSFSAIIVYNLNASPDNPSLGDSYEIQCTANTDEMINPNNVTVSWTGPNGTITNDSRLTIIPTVSNATSHTSILQFSYLSEADDGEYSCNLVMFGTVLNGSEKIELGNFSNLQLLPTETPPHSIASSSSSDLQLLPTETPPHSIASSSSSDLLPSTTGTPVPAHPSSLSSGVTLIVAVAVGIIIMIFIIITVGVVVIRLLQIHMSTKKQNVSKADTFLTKIPSLFDDTGSYMALGRDTASTCENINDITLWIEKSQMWSINEECMSMLSEELTDTKMLNCILNEGSQDSGRGMSIPNSFESSETDNQEGLLSMYCFWDESQTNADGNSDNLILKQFHCDIACSQPIYYPIPEHKPAQMFATSEAPFGGAEVSIATPTHETICILPHTHAENNLNLNPDNLIDQQNNESGKHVKDDASVNATPPLLEVVDSCNIDSVTKMMNHHENYQESAQESTKDSLLTETTIMTGAYVQHDVILKDDTVVTFPQTQPHPFLPDQDFTETQNTADETIGAYVDSDTAMQQGEVDDKVSPALSFCRKDISLSTGNNFIQKTAIELSDAALVQVAAPPKHQSMQTLTTSTDPNITENS